VDDFTGGYFKRIMLETRDAMNVLELGELYLLICTLQKSFSILHDDFDISDDPAIGKWLESVAVESEAYLDAN